MNVVSVVYCVLLRTVCSVVDFNRLRVHRSDYVITPSTSANQRHALPRCSRATAAINVLLWCPSYSYRQ